MMIPESRLTVTPASREKLEHEVATLINTCANPRKLRDMLALLADMDKELPNGQQPSL